MARAKKDEVPAEQLEDVVEQVTVNLDVDPNDPRKQPVVDGASVKPVDINVPAKK